jgi:hypothetical protein
MLSGRGSIGRAHPAEQDEAALLEQLAADRRALAIALPANR